MARIGATTARGRKISQTTIAKIEAGAEGAGGEVLGPIREQKTKPRPVSLSEALAFAAALNVAPKASSSQSIRATRSPSPRRSSSTYEQLMPGRLAGGRFDPTNRESTRFYRLQNYRPAAATHEHFDALGIKVVGAGPNA